MPTVLEIAEIVTDAIMEGLTPNPVRRDEFSINLAPSVWLDRASWRRQLVVIRRRIKAQFSDLEEQPTASQVEETYKKALADTRDLLITEVQERTRA